MSAEILQNVNGFPVSELDSSNRIHLNDHANISIASATLLKRMTDV
jgi:hypothetical protein